MGVRISGIKHTEEVNMLGNRIYLDADRDTYLQASTDDVLKLTVGGSVKATWNATGLRVGDTTAPTVSLEAANGLRVAAGNMVVSAGGVRAISGSIVASSGGLLGVADHGGVVLEFNANTNESAIGAATRIGTVKTFLYYGAHSGALFDAAGLTDSATIFTLPANAQLLGIAFRLDIRFVAAGLTDLDVTVGLAGDQSGFINPAAINMVTDAVATRYDDLGAYYGAFTEGVACATRTAIPIIAYATAVGANLNTTTAGEIRIFGTYMDFN